MKRCMVLMCRLCVAVFGVVGVASAQTITSSYLTKSITATFLDKTLNPDGTWTFRLSWSWTNTGSHGVGSGHVQVNGADRVYVMNGNDSGTWVNPAIAGGTASVTIRTKIDYYGDYDVKTFVITKPTEVTLPKKVHLGLTNPSETQEMIYRVYQDGVLIEEVTVPPKMSMGAVIEVPENSQIEVFSLVKGLIKEGPNWIEDPGAVTELGQVGAVSGDSITPTTADPPPVVVVKPPENVPTVGPLPDQEKTIWKATPDTVDTERLDKSTYRQGVDKLDATMRETSGSIIGKVENVGTLLGAIKDLMGGDAPGSDPEPAPSEPENVPGMPADTVGAAAKSKLPAPPALTPPSSVTSFTGPWKIPGVSSSFSVAVDLTDYDVGITIFKALVRACLAVLFFVAVVREIRSAFAG